MNFKEELERRAKIVDEFLDSWLPPVNAYPEIIHQAIRYSIFAGGKRLRPALVMAGAEAAGGDILEVMPAACALELIHTYSLVHDDLPSMDNDDFRRGKPTCHKVFGETVAILVGDALLTFAFQLLASELKSLKALQVIQEIATFAGTAGMIGGQVVDTLSEFKADADTVEYIHRHKTGALFKASVRAGAILAGASEEELFALSNYADCLGLAFQITDDILDIEGDELTIGKPVGSDLRNKKITYPAVFGLPVSKEKAAQAVACAFNYLQGFNHQADFLRELACFVLERKS